MPLPRRKKIVTVSDGRKLVFETTGVVPTEIFLEAERQEPGAQPNPPNQPWPEDRPVGYMEDVYWTAKPPIPFPSIPRVRQRRTKFTRTPS